MSRRLLVAAILFAVLSLGATSAFSQSVEKRLASLESQVALLRSQLSALSGTVEPLPGQVTALGAAIASLEAQIASLPGAPAITLVVECSNGRTVAGALAEAGERAASVQIEIVGSCTEDVHVSRSNTFLRGRSAGDGVRSLSVGNAHSVFLEQLTLTGGGLFLNQASVSADRLTVTGAREGVALQHGSNATVRNFLIDGSLERGVSVGLGCMLVADWGRIDGRGTATDAGAMSYGGAIQIGDTIITGHPFGAMVSGPGTVNLSGGSVQGNASGGIYVSQGGRLALSSTTVEDNGWVGIYVEGGQATLVGAAVRRNGLAGADGGGIRARQSGALTLLQTSVLDNGRIGVEVRDLSSLWMHTMTITGNAADGIALGSLSLLQAEGPNVVSGNGGWGLACASSARYRGSMDASGNGAGPIAGTCTPE